MVAKYVPADAQETSDMMDVLDDRLQHANSAVVLAAIKVFLHLTMSMPDVHQKVQTLHYMSTQPMPHFVQIIISHSSRGP